MKITRDRKLRIQKVHKPGDVYYVMFNPEEYTLGRDNKFATQEIPGLSGPLVQFVSGGQTTLDMELFFDTWDTQDLPKKDVRDETKLIVCLMEIDGELHAPPVLDITWSTLHLRCVLSKVSQKFTMFAEDGTPVRARLSVTFSEFIDPAKAVAESNCQTTDFTKEHIVIEGETLSGIAAHLYDDPAQWRPIALANALADPRAIVAGQRLQVPSLPYTDPASGEVVR